MPGGTCRAYALTSREQNLQLASRMGGTSLGECAQKQTCQLGIHILVIAYRNTTYYSTEMQSISSAGKMGPPKMQHVQISVTSNAIAHGHTVSNAPDLF